MKNQKINIVIIFLVSILVMYFILKDDFSEITKLITSINIWWVIFSAGLVLVFWFFQALSLMSISNSSDKPLSFKESYKSTIIGHFFSAITPSATGGQPLQIYFLKNKNLDLGTATNYVVAQSTFYQIALVLIGLIAVILNYFLDFFPKDNFIKYLVIIGFTINTIVIIVLGFITFGKKTNTNFILKLINFLHKLKIIHNKDRTMEKAKKTMDNFYMSAKALNDNKEVLFKGIIYNFIGILFLYIIPITVAYAFSNYADLNIIVTLVASAYVMLIGAFVPIPGGSGGIEFAFAVFFGYYISGPTLMAMLLIWRFVTYYLVILIGGITIIINKR